MQTRTEFEAQIKQPISVHIVFLSAMLAIYKYNKYYETRTVGRTLYTKSSLLGL